MAKFVSATLAGKDATPVEINVEAIDVFYGVGENTAIVLRNGQYTLNETVEQFVSLLEQAAEV